MRTRLENGLHFLWCAHAYQGKALWLFTTTTWYQVDTCDCSVLREVVAQGLLCSRRLQISFTFVLLLVALPLPQLLSLEAQHNVAVSDSTALSESLSQLTPIAVQLPTTNIAL